MKKVLIITATYPATGGGRTEKFVKFMRCFGYEPVILTTSRNKGNSAPKVPEIETNDMKVFRSFSIKRTPFRILSRYFGMHEAASYLERLMFIPDLDVTWAPDAIIKGLRILRKENIELIFSTSPPESTHIIAAILNKLTGKKWIADFRDLWTQKKVTYRPPTIFHHKIATKLEKYFFLKADHIIANTEENKMLYLNSFPINRNKVTVITNGYDPEDLKLINTQTFLNKDRLNIGYMGTFDKRGFPWKEFLIALAKFIDSKQKAKVKLNIYGELPSGNVIHFIGDNGLKSYIKFYGESSHSDAVRLTAENDLLLLLLYETDYSEAIVPLKLYSYLIMGKPIFALSPENGASARIIMETNTGKIVSPKNAEGILKTFTEYYERWSVKRTLEIFPNGEEIKKYDAKILTEKLARVFDGVSQVGVGMKI